MANLKDRLQSAIKQEKGVLLSPLEAKQLATTLGILKTPNKVDKGTSDGVKSAASVVVKQEPVTGHTRWMIKRDIPAVELIDKSTPFPWGQDRIVTTLRQRNAIGMVCEHDDEVVGFMVYLLARKELELLHFAVHPRHRGKTIGTQMIAKLAGKLNKDHRTRLTAEVVDCQTGMHVFLSKNHFYATAAYRDSYRFTRNWDLSRPAFVRSEDQQLSTAYESQVKNDSDDDQLMAG